MRARLSQVAEVRATIKCYCNTCGARLKKKHYICPVCDRKIWWPIALSNINMLEDIP